MASAEAVLDCPNVKCAVLQTTGMLNVMNAFCRAFASFWVPKQASSIFLIAWDESPETESAKVSLGKWPLEGQVR